MTMLKRALLALALVSLAACGDDDGFGPPDSGGRRDSGPGDANVPDTSDPVDAGDGGTDPDGGDAGPDCTGDDGCYSCEPTEEIQLLNACNEVGCLPFDNAARIARLNPDGSLPPLP